MIAAQALILNAYYASKTFDFIASFTVPVIVFGAALNINRLAGRTIEQNTMVQGGRIFMGLTSFGLAPLSWWKHFSDCKADASSVSLIAEPSPEHEDL